jgi:hypothetical protein
VFPGDEYSRDNAQDTANEQQATDIDAKTSVLRADHKSGLKNRVLIAENRFISLHVRPGNALGLARGNQFRAATVKIPGYGLVPKIESLRSTGEDAPKNYGFGGIYVRLQTGPGSFLQYFQEVRHDQPIGQYGIGSSGKQGANLVEAIGALLETLEHVHKGADVQYYIGIGESDNTLVCQLRYVLYIFKPFAADYGRPVLQVDKGPGRKPGEYLVRLGGRQAIVAFVVLIVVPVTAEWNHREPDPVSTMLENCLDDVTDSTMALVVEMRGYGGGDKKQFPGAGRSDAGKYTQTEH